MRKIKSELISDIVSYKKSESSSEIVESKFFDYGGISRERYDIETYEQSKYYGKDIGRYELISIPSSVDIDDSLKNKISKIFADVLKDIIGKINSKDKILVVGLGNRHISADSLGTSVIKNINITLGGVTPKVMAFCPSVLGLTGIETYDIISGVVDKIKPTHIIFIDSLCASSKERLGRSIQVSNTGICPGSGIGNNRKCLDKSMAKCVISIGVPLLIYASTFVVENLQNFDIDMSRINSIMQSIKNKPNLDKIYKFCADIKNVINKDMDDTIVTIKDIEESVENLGEIISTAINIALGVNY